MPAPGFRLVEQARQHERLAGAAVDGVAEDFLVESDDHHQRRIDALAVIERAPSRWSRDRRWRSPRGTRSRPPSGARPGPVAAHPARAGDRTRARRRRLPAPTVLRAELPTDHVDQHEAARPATTKISSRNSARMRVLQVAHRQRAQPLRASSSSQACRRPRRAGRSRRGAATPAARRHIGDQACRRCARKGRHPGSFDPARL